MRDMLKLLRTVGTVFVLAMWWIAIDCFTALMTMQSTVAFVIGILGTLTATWLVLSFLGFVWKTELTKCVDFFRSSF